MSILCTNGCVVTSFNKNPLDKFFLDQVLIMGILIILGVIALIFGIQQKLSKTTENIVELSIPLKQGQVIRSVDIDASGGILLWIGNPEASDQKQTILHVDRSGAIKTYFYITTF